MPDDIWYREYLAVATKLDAATQERDELRAELSISYEVHGEMAKREDEIAAAIGAEYLLDPPDGGDVSLAEGVQRIKAERDALRSALKPFALMATELEYEGSKWLDHETHWLKCFDFQLEPTVGDLRLARAALKGDDCG